MDTDQKDFANRRAGSRSQSLEWTLVAAGAGLAAATALLASRARRSYSFDGKSVVITGGSRGLGLVLARQLAAQGARLTVIARDESELRRAADNIHDRQPSADVLAVAADVRERDDVERAVAQTMARYGRVDVLINNAGIIQAGPLDHMTLSDYDDAMKTHFWGALFMVLAVLPHMRHQGAGRIVNIASIGGRIAVPHMLPYSASKFALAGLSDGLRIELAREHIVVTTVCPGLMRIGSALNADFKGRQAQEYAWFAISSSLPGVTVGAESAARQILDACQRGAAELVITVPAKLAILARAIAPEVFAEAMALINRLLPRRAGPDGDVGESGRAIGSAWNQSAVLTPMLAAAQENNEL